MTTSASQRPSERAPLSDQTVCAAFARVVEAAPNEVALRSRDDSTSYTWSELSTAVQRLAAGLAGLGVGRGDSVALLLPNRVECHVADYAALHLGAVPFTIYNSSSPEQIRHQLSAAGSSILVTERRFRDQVEAAIDGLDAELEIISIDGEGSEHDLAWVEAQAQPDFDFEAAWRAIDPEDPVTLIFTSGTTGPPKAALWAHRTVMSQLRALDAALPLPSENVVSVLPMAHAGGRLTGHYFPLAYGATITCCPDMSELPLALAEVHPDAFFSVPRLWEKLQVAIEGMIGQLSPEEQQAVQRVRENGGEGESEALTGILARLGLDRIKSAFVGGAPSSPELSSFFRSVGVPLLEAYGLTEGSLNVFNRIELYKLGTAGLPLPGVELCLVGSDPVPAGERFRAPAGETVTGEILIRGGLTFIGYRGQPEKTAETLDADGWLHTGDIAEVDDEGFVKVVDRMKEIIISAAGKNMSPANIENAIKGESSLIGQVVAIGDGRRYNTALITLDPEAAANHAKASGTELDLETLVEQPQIQETIAAAVEKGNARLARVEQVRKYTLLGVAWAPDSEELTPTAKVKRRNINQKYAAEIEALYAES